MGVRSAIEFAADRKRMPAFDHSSIHDLTAKLGMTFPVSLLDLLKALNDLVPAGVTYDSGRFAAGNVHVSSQLYLQSDGGVSFSGQVHESGVSGDNFVLAMALLDVKDDSGNALVWVHSDTIAGQLDVGFSDKEWHDYGFNQLVKDNWDAVKNTRVEHRLHVSTDPLQVTETFIAGLFVAVGVVFASMGAANVCPDSQQWVCGWGAVGKDPNIRLTPGNPSNPPPDIAVEYYCR
jgi:hypothetical protein